jgi:ribose-phosphate pyrophosphokinase
MIDAFRRASADRITAVIPFYGYARQDRKTRPREPISAKLVANLLTSAGANRILTMDLHAGQIQGFFDIPVDHLSGVPILADYFIEKGLEDVVVVSPDLGGVTRARDFAERMQVPIAIVDKRRPEPNVAEVMNIIGKVRDKNIIVIDDMIDTAGTLVMGAEALLERGAKSVYACCTHPVFSGKAIERIAESSITEVVVTNTIPLADHQMIDKITCLSVAPLLADTIRRVHDDLSVSILFS